MKKRIKNNNLEDRSPNSLGIIALSCRIKTEMIKNKIGINQLSKLTKLNKNIIQDWYNNDGAKKIDIDVLAIICCVLSKKITNFLE